MEECNRQGVKKIVCHPYCFKDVSWNKYIPMLIHDTEEYLQDKYGNGDYQPEVLSTEPVGKKLDLMVGLLRCMLLMEGVKYECACEWVYVERGFSLALVGFSLAKSRG